MNDNLLLLLTILTLLFVIQSLMFTVTLATGWIIAWNFWSKPKPVITTSTSSTQSVNKAEPIAVLGPQQFVPHEEPASPTVPQFVPVPAPPAPAIPQFVPVPAPVVKPTPRVPRPQISGKKCYHCGAEVMGHPVREQEAGTPDEPIKIVFYRCDNCLKEIGVKV
jgi:hypothetical protein